MAKKSLLEDAEYAGQRRFMIYYSDNIRRRLNPQIEAPPMEEFILRLESAGPSLARKGMQQSINDIVDYYKHKGSDEIRRVDNELKENGVFTISELRKRYSKEYKKIVAKGGIDSENDYYLLKGIADDSSTSIAERSAALKMIAAYETKIAET